MPRRSTATIADVAARAGVSRATVSRALNGTAQVTPATRAKIDQAIAETGFVTSAVGRALATGRTEAIAVLLTETLDELFADPTYATILRGITDHLGATPYLPVLLQAATPVEYDRALRHLSRRAVDAVIALSPYTGTPLLEALAELGLPVVLCGQVRDEPWQRQFTTIYADDEAGAEQAARALRVRGRSNVGALLGPASNPAATDRLTGYRRGLPGGLGPERVVWTGWDEESGRAAMAELLRRQPQLDGVLAASDRLAAGALAALRAAGRRVPADVSVIGFDDHTLAAHTHPPLTTIRQPLRQQGQLAARAALDLLAGGAPDRIVLPMELVTRASV